MIIVSGVQSSTPRSFLVISLHPGSIQLQPSNNQPFSLRVSSFIFPLWPGLPVLARLFLPLAATPPPCPLGYLCLLLTLFCNHPASTCSCFPPSCPPRNLTVVAAMLFLLILWQEKIIKIFSKSKQRPQ